MNDLTATELICPSGDGKDGLQINMSDIYRLEARKMEVAMVNKTKAPELMQTFEEGFSNCAKILPRIRYELSVAENEANKRASVVHLDEAPRILKEKGLINGHNPAGSADLREAVLNADEEYIKLKDRVEQIKAIWQFVKDKQHGFELSFSAVKKVYDSLSQYGALQGGAESSIDIGKARY